MATFIAYHILPTATAQQVAEIRGASQNCSPLEVQPPKHILEWGDMGYDSLGFPRTSTPRETKIKECELPYISFRISNPLTDNPVVCFCTEPSNWYNSDDERAVREVIAKLILREPQNQKERDTRDQITLAIEKIALETKDPRRIIGPLRDFAVQLQACQTDALEAIRQNDLPKLTKILREAPYLSAIQTTDKEHGSLVAEAITRKNFDAFNVVCDHLGIPTIEDFEVKPAHHIQLPKHLDPKSWKTKYYHLGFQLITHRVFQRPNGHKALLNLEPETKLRGVFDLIADYSTDQEDGQAATCEWLCTLLTTKYKDWVYQELHAAFANSKPRHPTTEKSFAILAQHYHSIRDGLAAVQAEVEEQQKAEGRAIMGVRRKRCQTFLRDLATAYLRQARNQTATQTRA